MLDVLMLAEGDRGFLDAARFILFYNALRKSRYLVPKLRRLGKACRGKEIAVPIHHHRIREKRYRKHARGYEVW